MAWRVADAADAFDSLSMPVPSRVYGPAEPSEAAVPRGASALLGASPSEPLAVAVARMVFRRMLAPGLIVTSARYVMRCAGVPAEPYLGSLASCFLPPTISVRCRACWRRWRRIMATLPAALPD